MDFSHHENKQPKITKDDPFLYYTLLEQLIKETDLTKQNIEEKNSELWFETLSGQGKLNFENNISYTGQVKYGVFESGPENIPCQISFTDGTKYEGEIHGNQLTGKGKFYFTTGATYEGEVLNGLRHGIGTYNSPDGTTYEGHWKNGLKDGQGTQIKGATKYEGEWKEGYMHGHGKMTWESGNFFEGEFQNNHINGNGYMIWNTTHEKYTGHWLNDLQDGFGIQTWYESKGDQKFLNNRYVGEWKEGKKQGYGVFFYSNGCSYEGGWYNNLKEGVGEFTYQDGRKFKGMFVKDQMIDNEHPVTLEIIEHFVHSKESKNDKSKLPSRSPSPNSKREKKVPKSTGELHIFHKGSIKRGLSNVKPLEIIAEHESENVKHPTNITNLTNVTNGTNKGVSTKDVVKKKKEEPKKVDPKKKSLNRFEPYLELTDLASVNPEIKTSMNEIYNIYLRNMTEMRRWYLSSIQTEPEPLTDEEKKKREEDMLKPPVCVNSNKVYRCMEIKNLWRFFRDVGIFERQFSISEFNRVFFQNTGNQLELFFVPEELEGQDIYNYLIYVVTDSKINFSNKNKPFVDYFIEQEQYLSNPSLHYMSEIIQNQKREIPQDTQEKIENTEEKIVDDLMSTFNAHSPQERYKLKNTLHFDIHDKKQAILARHFYQALSRAAFLKYFYEPIPFSQKVQNIFNLINSVKIQFKRGNRNSKSSLSRLENSFLQKETMILQEQAKLRNSEYKYIDDFAEEHETKLKTLFFNLYLQFRKGKKLNYNDMSVTYRFFYTKVIKKSNILKKLYPKKSDFIEVINHFDKNKPFYKKEEFEKGTEEIFKYVNYLLDIQFIFYEFCEMMLFICRKYILRNHLKEDEKNYLTVINHVWSMVKFDPIQKTEKLRGKLCYCYPKTEKHTKKEEMLEEQRVSAEKKKIKQMEKERYTRERQAMKLEDIDVVLKEEEEESEDDDY